MRIAVGSDVRSLHMARKVVGFVEASGRTASDIVSYDPRDRGFVFAIKTLCHQIQRRTADRGILVGLTGTVEAIAANKIPGIRAAVCHDIHCAHQSVEHDDSNIIVLGSMVVGSWVAKDLLQAFLDAAFSGREDFTARLVQLEEMEAAWRRSPIL